MSETERIERIAKIAHEVNRAYCQACGDDSQPAWEDAPEWQKDSARQGVIFAFISPGVTPAQMHDRWMQIKAEAGWAYGPTKDPVKKTHPCMVPYDQLPVEQRAKDHLFRAVVRSA